MGGFNDLINRVLHGPQIPAQGVPQDGGYVKLEPYPGVLGNILDLIGVDKSRTYSTKPFATPTPSFDSTVKTATGAVPTNTPVAPSPVPVAPASLDAMKGYPDANRIQTGITAFNPQAPIATASAVLADAVKRVADSGTKVDPFLPLVTALKETRGGLDLTHPTRQIGGAYEGVNNLYNVHDNANGKFVNYPDFKTAILGGTNPNYKDANGNPITSQGFVNMILNSPAYENYRKSGNLNDFFATYTPAADNNPDYATQIEQYLALKKKFQ